MRVCARRNNGGGGTGGESIRSRAHRMTQKTQYRLPTYPLEEVEGPQEDEQGRDEEDHREFPKGIQREEPDVKRRDRVRLEQGHGGWIPDRK